MKKYLLAAVAALALGGPALALDCVKEGSDVGAHADLHLHNLVISAQSDQSLANNISAASSELLNKSARWFSDQIKEANYLIQITNNLHKECGYSVMEGDLGIGAMRADRDMAQAELRRRAGKP